jgi:hypothetical protein
MVMNYPIVLVKWADAHCSEGGWLTLEDYEDTGETIVESVGFLVPVPDSGSKKDHVTIWQTYCEGDVIHAIHIPVGMIRDIKVLCKVSD